MTPTRPQLPTMMLIPVTVFEVSELRRLPFGWSVVFFRNKRPMLMFLTPYWKSKYAAEINMTKKLYARSLLDDSEGDLWEHHLSTTTDAEVIESNVVDSHDSGEPAVKDDRQEPVTTADDEKPRQKDEPGPPSVTMF